MDFIVDTMRNMVFTRTFVLFLTALTTKCALAWPGLSSSYYPGRFWPEHSVTQPDLSYWTRMQDANAASLSTRRSLTDAPTWAKRYNELLMRRKLEEFRAQSAKIANRSPVDQAKYSERKSAFTMPGKRNTFRPQTNQPRPIISMATAKSRSEAARPNWPSASARVSFFSPQTLVADKITPRVSYPFTPNAQSNFQRSFPSYNWPDNRRNPNLQVAGVTAYSYGNQKSLGPSFPIAFQMAPAVSDQRYAYPDSFQIGLPYSMHRSDYTPYENSFAQGGLSKQSYAKGDIFAGTVHNYVPTFKIHPTYTNNFPTKSPKSTKKLVENLRLSPPKNLYAKKQPKIAQVGKPLPAKPAVKLMFPVRKFGPGAYPMSFASRVAPNNFKAMIPFPSNSYDNHVSSTTKAFQAAKPLNGYQQAAIRHEQIRNNIRSHRALKVAQNAFQWPRGLLKDGFSPGGTPNAFQRSTHGDWLATTNANPSHPLPPASTSAYTLENALSSISGEAGRTWKNVNSLSEFRTTFPNPVLPHPAMARSTDSSHGTVFPGPKISLPALRTSSVKSEFPVHRFRSSRLFNRTIERMKADSHSPKQRNSPQTSVNASKKSEHISAALELGRKRAPTIQASDSQGFKHVLPNELAILGFVLNQEMHKRGRIFNPRIFSKFPMHSQWIKRGKIPVGYNPKDTEEFGLTKERIEAYIKKLENEQIINVVTKKDKVVEAEPKTDIAERNLGMKGVWTIHKLEELGTLLNDSLRQSNASAVHDDDMSTAWASPVTRSQVGNASQVNTTTLLSTGSESAAASAKTNGTLHFAINNSVPVIQDHVASTKRHKHRLARQKINESETGSVPSDRQTSSDKRGRIKNVTNALKNYTIANVTSDRRDRTTSRTLKTIKRMRPSAHGYKYNVSTQSFLAGAPGKRHTSQIRQQTGDFYREQIARKSRRSYHPRPAINVHQSGYKKSLVPTYRLPHFYDNHGINDDDEGDTKDEDDNGGNDDDDNYRDEDDHNDEYNTEDLYADDRTEEEEEGIYISKPKHNHGNKSLREDIARTNPKRKGRGSQSLEVYNQDTRDDVPIVNIDTPDMNLVPDQMKPLIAESPMQQYDERKSKVYEPAEIQETLVTGTLLEEAQQNQLKLLTLRNKIVADREDMIETLHASLSGNTNEAVSEAVDDGRGDITLRHKIAQPHIKNPNLTIPVSAKRGHGELQAIKSYVHKHRDDSAKAVVDPKRRMLKKLENESTAAIENSEKRKLGKSGNESISITVNSERKSGLGSQSTTKWSEEEAGSRKSSVAGYSVLDRGKLLHDGLLGGFIAPVKPVHKITEEEIEAKKEEQEALQLIGKALQTTTQKIPDPQEVIGLEKEGVRKMNKADVMAQLSGNVVPDLTVVAADNSGLDVNALPTTNLDASQLSASEDGMNTAPTLTSSKVAGSTSLLAGLHSSVDEADINSVGDTKTDALDHDEESLDAQSSLSETNSESADSLAPKKLDTETSMINSDESDHEGKDFDSNVGPEAREELSRFTKDRDMATTSNDEMSDNMERNDEEKGDEDEDRERQTDAKGESISEEMDRGVEPEDRPFEATTHAHQSSRGDSSIEFTLHGGATPLKIQQALDTVAEKENVQKLIAEAKHKSDTEMEEVLKNTHMEARSHTDTRREKKQSLKTSHPRRFRKIPTPLPLAIPSMDNINLISPNDLDLRTSFSPEATISSETLSNPLETIDPPIKGAEYIAPDGTVLSAPLKGTPNTIMVPETPANHAQEQANIGSGHKAELPAEVYVGPPLAEVRKTPDNLPPIANFLQPLPENLKIPPDTSASSYAQHSQSPTHARINGESAIAKLTGQQHPKEEGIPSKEEAALVTMKQNSSTDGNSGNPTHDLHDIKVTGITHDQNSNEIISALKELENLKAEVKPASTARESSSEARHFTTRNATDEKADGKQRESQGQDLSGVNSETREAVKDLTLAIKMLEQRLVSVRSGGTASSNMTGDNVRAAMKPNEILAPSSMDAAITHRAVRSAGGLVERDTTPKRTPFLSLPKHHGQFHRRQFRTTVARKEKSPQDKTSAHAAKQKRDAQKHVTIAHQRHSVTRRKHNQESGHARPSYLQTVIAKRTIQDVSDMKPG